MDKPALVAILSLFLSSTAYSEPPPLRVNVVNTPTVDINGPVNTNVNGTVDTNVVNTPNVNVVSMPRVQVDVPNALDVNVQNMPGVTIENGPLSPVPVSPPVYPREIVRIYERYAITNFQLFSPPTYRVPADKIFVIETMSLTYSDISGNGIALVDLATENNTGVLQQIYRFLFVESPAQHNYVSHNTARIYFKSNERIFLIAERPDNVDSDIITINISGYLVPANSPSLSP